MNLGNLLDINKFRQDVDSKRIDLQYHPSLPLVIANYSRLCTIDGYWPDHIQKCRGLIIETNSRHIDANSKIIARPFHKFFGLNWAGQEEYQEANLPNVEPIVTEKMDGWFGIMWEYEGKFGVASRGSFTSPGALFATEKLQRIVKYGAIEEFPKGYSPIFEIIFKEGRVVVDYPFEGLVLLGCVDIEIGEELSYDQLQIVWAKIAGYSADNHPWIRLVKSHHMSLDQVQAIQNRKNQEGFVLTYSRPGTWPIKVKVKLEEYKRLHRLITNVTPQQVWEHLSDPINQWMDTNTTPNNFRTWINDWKSTMFGQFHETLEKVMGLYDADAKSDYEAGKISKQTAYQFLTTKDPKLGPIALFLLEGKITKAYDAIWDLIRPHGRCDLTFYQEGGKE